MDTFNPSSGLTAPLNLVLLICTPFLKLSVPLSTPLFLEQSTLLICFIPLNIPTLASAVLHSSYEDFGARLFCLKAQIFYFL